MALPPDPQALMRQSMAALIAGRDGESADALAEAHRAFIDRGDIDGAARSAFWLGFQLVNTGQAARGGGWLARAQRLIDDARLDSVVSGYLLLPGGRRAMREGDFAAANAAFSEAVAIGERFVDADLIALGRHGQGRAHLRMGRIPEGLALLDEVMVGAMISRATPVTVGVVYCGVVDACHEIFDLRRAQEWTEAFARWCAMQPDRVPFRGACLVHRAEILQLHGEWTDAMSEIQSACVRLLEQPGQSEIGSAFYQRGELHRLRGEFDDAERAYHDASQHGRKPQPGLALLRLARGKIAAAAASVARATQDMRGTRWVACVFAAAVEIALANDDVATARAAAHDLRDEADRTGAPYLRALSAHANGAVLLAEGEPAAALATLQEAWSIWREIDAPYEIARVRVLIGLADRALGDADTAMLELDAARAAFERLGATPDVERLARLTERPGAHGPAHLTARELQVLTLVATGKTNRVIAGRLGISEKTVARHVANVFLKLNLSSRAAATAYAYEHGLRSVST